MSRPLVGFDFRKTPDRITLFLFPALFIIALLFPPLLLLIPAAVVFLQVVIPEISVPVIVPELSSSVRLPGRRSPPLGA